MIYTFVSRMLERSTFERASRLPPAERVQFLRRASAFFSFCAGLALVNALGGVVLCVYLCRIYFSSLTMPHLHSAERLIGYIGLFAALTLFFVFLAVLSATARRILYSSVAEPRAPA